MIPDSYSHGIMSEEQAPCESFHDSHVRALTWDSEKYQFIIRIGYILEWIVPAMSGHGYRFRVAPADLIFDNADEVSIILEWSRSILDAEIESVKVLEQRKTPNGSIQFLYQIIFGNPDGSIKLWSTGYSVGLRAEAVETTSPGKW